MVNSYGTSASQGNNLSFTASSGGPTTLTFTNATNVITSGTSAGRYLYNNSVNLLVDIRGAVDITSSANNELTIGGVGDTKIWGGIFNGSTGIRGLTKVGAGTLRLYGTNTYNGTSLIREGKLVMVNAKSLPAGSPTLLDGGTLKVDYPDAASDTLGNLSLTANSEIDLGTGTSGSSIKFASGTNWSNKILTVANSSTGAKLYIINTASVATNQIKSAENTNAVASLAADGLLTFVTPLSSGSTYTGVGYTGGTENEVAGNGLSNLMNYALGQNGPTASFPAGPVLSTDSNGMTLTATGRSDDSSLRFYVQWTTDLSGVSDSWDLHTTEVFAPNLAGTIPYGADRKFIRLKVVKP